ncbi:MAG TPA: bifunctional (p)ppGpp synthetase/guanosine-3',5'-bis(diphosphate) 3'-pyrophosphohydrolase [Burkholderiales bacterium]
MVSVVRLHPQNSAAALDPIAAGLAAPERALLERALGFAEPLYAGQVLATEEPLWPHALGLAGNLASIGLDPAGRAAGLLFATPKYLGGTDALQGAFGAEIAGLAAGVEKLYQLRVATRGGRSTGAGRREARAAQTEVLRKMVLGMVEDIRVVLIRLASRTQTLRWFAKHDGAERRGYAEETLDIYAPLANRLGVWQFKWEMEDLSLRILDPEVYKRIAAMLDEKRLEREQYIRDAMAQTQRELAAAGIQAEVAGRPKHIYSIWNKMRAKSIDFSEVYDVRALRIIVPGVKDCYTALGVVHNLWQPIPKEFDDYISRPKGNRYQSLHTAVMGPGGRTLEVQIRTEAMHRHAEFGIAAHWRYKEAGGPAQASDGFDDKIALLRQLLAWRDEVDEGTQWAEKTRAAGLDDTIYVLTPQGRVLDLPAGSTPVDFAYALHSDLGHRCRGAKVDGQLVALDTPLASGQRVEIVAAKTGGPTRDWLLAERGFVRSPRARQKVRQWFNAQALVETIAAGRATVEREARREGASQVGHDELAKRLGFDDHDALFTAVARDEINLRQLHAALQALKGGPQKPEATLAAPSLAPRRPRTRARDGGVLVVGMDRLLTQLAQCCKPVPPDAIRGFVTRGKGVSIHREDCDSLRRLAERLPERLLDAQWSGAEGAYTVQVLVTATDRQGLLRDIGDALARERVNVNAVRTQTRDELATMRFTFTVSDLEQLRRALAVVKTVPGVIRAARA